MFVPLSSGLGARPQLSSSNNHSEHNDGAHD